MTESQEANQAPGADDPRYGFAMVTDQVGGLIHATSADQLDGPTPCAEFAVRDLLDHLVLVMRRVAVIGNGNHWSEVQDEQLGEGWHDAYRSAAHDVMLAWTDAAKLGATYEVPWGEIPGAALMLTYTAELAVHGWDLAHATGQAFAVEDDLLRGPLTAAQFIPAEGRGVDIPFDPVVDPGESAPVLDQIAGWMGRDVLTAR